MLFILFLTPSLLYYLTDREQTTTQRICLLFQLLCCSTGSYDPLSISVFTEFNSRSQLVSICGKKKSKQRASEVLFLSILKP